MLLVLGETGRFAAAPRASRLNWMTQDWPIGGLIVETWAEPFSQPENNKMNIPPINHQQMRLLLFCIGKSTTPVRNQTTSRICF